MISFDRFPDGKELKTFLGLSFKPESKQYTLFFLQTFKQVPRNHIVFPKRETQKLGQKVCDLNFSQFKSIRRFFAAEAPLIVPAATFYISLPLPLIQLINLKSILLPLATPHQLPSPRTAAVYRSSQYFINEKTLLTIVYELRRAYSLQQITKKVIRQKMAYLTTNQLTFAFPYPTYTYLYILPSSSQDGSHFITNSFIPIVSTQLQENVYTQWDQSSMIKLQAKTTEQLPPPPQNSANNSTSNFQTQKDSFIKPSQPSINTSTEIKSRNILPNNINLILSYVRRPNKSGHLVSQIIQGLNDNSYTAKKFYSYQLYLKDHLRNEASMLTLKNITYFCDPACAIFSIKQQRFYNKVCRILIKRFLSQQAIISLLSSKKMLKTKKIDHLHSYRFISSSLALRE